MNAVDALYVAAKALPWANIGWWIGVMIAAGFALGMLMVFGEWRRERQPKPPRIPELSAWERWLRRRENRRASYRAWRKLQKAKSR
jgi:hypothetical protein